MKAAIVRALWALADLIGVEDESHWLAQFILWLDSSDDDNEPPPGVA